MKGTDYKDMPEEKIPVKGNLILEKDMEELVRAEFNQLVVLLNGNIGKLKTPQEQNARRMAQLMALAMLLGDGVSEAEISHPEVFMEMMGKLIINGSAGYKEAVNILKIHTKEQNNV